MSFLSNFECLPILTRPNTSILFHLVDILKSKLSPSLSPFIINVWSTLLIPYLDQTLCIYLIILLRFGCLINYKRPDAFISSKNLLSALIQPDVIDKNIVHDLALSRIMQVNLLTDHSILSPLGLVPKHNRRFRKIHHYLYPHGSLVNNFIAFKSSTLSYLLLQNVFEKIVVAGKI